MRRLMVNPVTYDEAKLRETQPYKSTLAFLREVVGARCMAVLEGEPGVGKTFGALSFARRHNIPFITVVERFLLEKGSNRTIVGLKQTTVKSMRYTCFQQQSHHCGIETKERLAQHCE